MLTKVARLFEEEKIDAVNKAVNETSEKKDKEFVFNMLRKDMDLIDIMELSGLTKTKVQELQKEFMKTKLQ